MWRLTGAARCLAPAGVASALLLAAPCSEKNAFPYQFQRGLCTRQHQHTNRPVQCSETQLLSVITWNILAAPYTKYNWKFHRAGEAMECELQEQTRQRYSIAGRELVERSVDVVLLQECEADFFSPLMNSEADKIKQQYHVLACRIGENPGTAVLVKRDGRATLMDHLHQKPLSITVEDGSSPYVPTVVRLMVGGLPVTVVSVHVQYWQFGKEQAIRQLKQVEEALIGQGSILVGGDFNAGTSPANEYLPELEANTFFSDLKRAKLAPGVMTGLVGDFSAQVVLDHIYVSRDLGIASSHALAAPLNGGPYSTEGSGPADVVSASDHVPVLAYIKI